MQFRVVVREMLRCGSKEIRFGFSVAVLRRINVDGVNQP